MDQQVLVEEYRITFLRSATKPFQAIPVIQNGVVDKFGLTSKETALFATSHRGEDYHIIGSWNIQYSIAKHT